MMGVSCCWCVLQGADGMEIGKSAYSSAMTRYGKTCRDKQYFSCPCIPVVLSMAITRAWTRHPFIVYTTWFTQGRTDVFQPEQEFDWSESSDSHSHLRTISFLFKSPISLTCMFFWDCEVKPQRDSVMNRRWHKENILRLTELRFNWSPFL